MDENKNKRWQWQIQLDQSSCYLVNNFWSESKKGVQRHVYLFLVENDAFFSFSRLSWSQNFYALHLFVVHGIHSYRLMIFVFSFFRVEFPWQMYGFFLLTNKYHMCCDIVRAFGWYFVFISFSDTRIDFIVLIVPTESLWF